MGVVLTLLVAVGLGTAAYQAGVSHGLALQIPAGATAAAPPPYAYYPYDGPIYGYSDLAPDRVVTEVQAQLQRDGYYHGPIDGVLGPMTRHAIAAFQADHGLAVTSTVDEPTLATLGIS